jgi:hypothetical protein
MKQPKCYINNSQNACNSKNSIYGLWQISHRWYTFTRVEQIPTEPAPRSLKPAPMVPDFAGPRPTDFEKKKKRKEKRGSPYESVESRSTFSGVSLVPNPNLTSLTLKFLTPSAAAHSLRQDCHSPHGPHQSLALTQSRPHSVTRWSLVVASRPHLPAHTVVRTHVTDSHTGRPQKRKAPAGQSVSDFCFWSWFGSMMLYRFLISDFLFLFLIFCYELLLEWLIFCKYVAISGGKSGDFQWRFSGDPSRFFWRFQWVLHGGFLCVDFSVFQ